jgi:methylsterol monooxygenase
MRLVTDHGPAERNKLLSGSDKNHCKKSRNLMAIPLVLKHAIQVKDNILLSVILCGILLTLNSNFARESWNVVKTRDPMELWVWTSLGLTTAIYWIYSLLLMPLDLYNLLPQFKIQPTKHVNLSMHWRCAKQVIFNQIFINVPLSFGLYHFNRWRGSLEIRDLLPSSTEFMSHLIVFIVLEEIGFYYSHRIAHHPSIYKYIHKQHHLFTAPIGMAATYAHPIEHLVSNMLPLSLGPLLMNSHIVTVWIWYSLAIINTINSHSGYDFYGFPTSLFHDYHHYAFNSNFGVLGVLDYLHGTDSGFEQWSKEYSNK